MSRRDGEVGSQASALELASAAFAEARVDPVIDTAALDALAATRPIPQPGDAPLFEAPWQAEALGLARALVAAGVVTAEQWAQALGAAIRRAQAAGDPDDGSTYYAHVLDAVERLLDQHGIVSADDRSARKAAWIAAYRATPHGAPVDLAAASRPPLDGHGPE